MTFSKGSALAFAVSAAMCLSSHLVNAQDDLDSLLDDLEDTPAETAAEKPAAKEEAPAAPAAEEKVEEKAEEAAAPAAEEKAEEKVEEAAAPVAEETTEEAEAPAAEEKVEEKAEEEAAPVAEEKAEEPAEEIDAAVEKEEAPAAEAAKADEQALNLLSDLESEPEETPAAAPAAPAAVAASEKKEEAKPAADQVIKPIKKKRAASPDDDILEELMIAEELRRGSLDLQAEREVKMARQAQINREWDEMFRLYTLAARHLNDRPETAHLRAEARDGMGEAKFQAGKEQLRRNNRPEAIKFFKEAQKLGHQYAGQQLQRLAADVAQDGEKDIEDIKHRWNDEDYKTKRAEIRRRLRHSRQYYTTAEYYKAMEEVELVLRMDAHNNEAIRLRKQIAERMRTIERREFFTTREEMMHGVSEAWRPVYAVNSAELSPVDGETKKRKLDEDTDRTQEQDILNRMKAMKLPSVSFRPPATIIDAVDFFRVASKDYDDPKIPADQRGINMVLQLNKILTAAAPAAAAEEGGDDAFSTSADDTAEAEAASTGPVPQIPSISASNISLFEALNLVCNVTGFKFTIRGSVVMVMPKEATIDELVTRSYNVLDLFVDRVTSAAGDVKESKHSQFGAGSTLEASEGGSQERDWKQFFSEMGVSWPPNSQITYIKTIGKLRVKNTEENLAIFEQALNDLNVTPTLVEIETRFVEVSQEDLNSLGFEWILNNDYSLNIGGKLGKALGLKDGSFSTTSGSTSTTTSSSGTAIGGGGTTGSAADGTTASATTTATSWGRSKGSHKNIGVNSMGGSSEFQNGNRFLSTVGNHISGSGSSTNDQFMRINGFLGNADISMILHMLSQRSDTDLLSAPKVVTKSGQQAVIKVVTEYIYPQDYDVTIESSGSSGNSNSSSSGGSSILAMVEPQNFTMREVGVILDVTPEVTSEGQMINLELKPEVVDEPDWHDYGMKIPIQASQQSSNIFDALTPELVKALGVDYIKDAMTSNKEQEYYTVPMEQPFFHRRMIDTHLSIYNGATVVMGGLITEERKAMDDKVPFLGDLPFIGRLFRSRSEWSNKRNLLIFVTARLVDPRGRQVKMGSGDDVSSTMNGSNAPVTAAPEDK